MSNGGGTIAVGLHHVLSVLTKLGLEMRFRSCFRSGRVGANSESSTFCLFK